MIPAIRKILYCTDLSDSTGHVFPYAAAIAGRFGAGITVLHVLEDVPEGSKQLVTSAIGAKRWEEITRKNAQEVREILHTQIEKFRKEAGSVPSEISFVVDAILVKIGHPVEEILHQVEAGGFDLLVMGSHGAGRVADVMLGSTTGRVIRQCRKPVLTVRHPEGAD